MPCRLLRPALPLLLTAASGCNHLFYQPDNFEHASPSQLGLTFQDVYVPTSEGWRLHLWHFRSAGRKPFGTIVHFHGNAENMSSHFVSLAWVTKAGFDLVTFDYRGYGRSEGMASRAGLIDDGRKVLAWVQQHTRSPNLFVVGQSLGGSVAIPALVEARVPTVRGVIIDSSYASYRLVARAKLASFVLTWPLQWPLSFLVSDDYSPVDYIAQLAPPVVIMHAPEDPVVPFEQGELLFEAARQPKEFWLVPGEGHMSAFLAPGDALRKRFMAYLCSHLQSAQAHCVSYNPQAN